MHGGVSPLTDSQISESVSALRREVGLGSGGRVDVRAVANALDLHVSYENTDGMLGCLILHPQRNFVIVSSNLQPLERQRFTLAHEIGHFRLHSAQDSEEMTMIFDDDHSLTILAEEAKEQDANNFARQLLIPGSSFHSSEDRNLDLALIANVASEFEVTHVSAAIRWIQLTKPRAVVVRLEGHNVRDRFRGQNGSGLRLPVDLLLEFKNTEASQNYDALTEIPSEKPRHRIVHLGRDFFLVAEQVNS